jgi:DNA polymerase-1
VPSLCLIDASGFLYRSYFALLGMSNRQGEATGALYGFIRSYLRLIEQLNPDYIAAVFDVEGGKKVRCELYKEYKAHRKPAPEELIKQIKEAQEFCQKAGIPLLAVPGFEADDTMASVAAWAKDQGLHVYISTSDKDMAQLVNDHIFLINPHKEYAVIDREKVQEQFGVPPEQLRDYLSILGDSSDNIPGISGFGAKGAVKLLQDYGSLEEIYTHVREIGGKKEELLSSQKELAFLSQKLVTLFCNVDFPHDLSFFTKTSGDRAALWHFLHSKNFHSLLKMVGDLPEDEKTSCRYHQILSQEEVKKLLNTLETATTVCVDTETTDIDPMRAKLVGIGLAVDEHDAYFIPFKQEYVSLLAPFFAKKERGFFGHNIKYDLHVLANHHMPVAKVSSDTMIESYLLNAHLRKHSLDELALVYFGKTKIPTEQLIGKGKSQITMDLVPIEKITEYCCEDVEYTTKLKMVLDKEIKERALDSILNEIEIPLIPILAKMETHGIFLDTKVLDELAKRTKKELEILQEEIYRLAGEPFNINSPKQLSEILFQKLGIPALKKGKTMPSTGAEVLETLAVSYPIAAKVLEYRSFEKLRSTYIETLPTQIHPKTGRIHCQFNQTVAATGRLSCQDPNLQNIPVRSELGSQIRKAFRPQEQGYSFLSFDYSQIELRILAHVTEDEGLLEAFRNDLDIHAFTASELFRVPINEVTEEMRSRAKAVNFGIVYGQQAFGLSQTMHISIAEATSFINAYFQRYKKIKQYLEEAKELARKTGKACSLTGRERLLPDINSPNMQLRSAAERLAVNTPFQATAADIIKMAMISVDKWLNAHQPKIRMLLQIHDELLFEVPDDDIAKAKAGITPCMEEVYPLKVPLKVKMSVGKNWMEC